MGDVGVGEKGSKGGNDFFAFIGLRELFGVVGDSVPPDPQEVDPLVFGAAVQLRRTAAGGAEKGVPDPPVGVFEGVFLTRMDGESCVFEDHDGPFSGAVVG